MEPTEGRIQWRLPVLDLLLLDSCLLL